MPEMTFTVQWPDGNEQSCYSPSLVMHDHLVVGHDYTLDDFLGRVRSALGEAGERVRAKFGVYCTSAAAQLDEIERQAMLYRSTSTVRVLAMDPDTLPGGTR